MEVIRQYRPELDQKTPDSAESRDCAESSTRPVRREAPRETQLFEQRC